jgi:antirestriction protein ArdC
LSYNSYDHDNLKPAEEFKIERRIFFDSKKADISNLTILPLEQLQTMRHESEVDELAIFDNVRESVSAWEKQAGQTLLLDNAIKYVRTPPVKHTSNQWEKSEYGRHTMSNMVYKMNYNISEDTRYDAKTKKSIPYAWRVTWSVSTNTPNGNRYNSIAGQSRKPYDNKADAEKYLAGRIKAYAHLFTEISPPIPKEYAEHFRVNGQLLPGYSVEGEPEIATPAAEHGGVFNSTENEPRKERENMKEPFNIEIMTHKMKEQGITEGVWLKLPATTEQIINASERLNAEADELLISNFESPLKIPLEVVTNTEMGYLDILAEKLETLDNGQILKLNAIIAIMPEPVSISSIIGHAHNIDFHEHYPEINTHAELGEHVFKMSGLIQIPEEWAAAVDREKLGQLAAEKEKGIFTDTGYLVENNIPWEAVPEILNDYQLAPQIDSDTTSNRTPSAPATTTPQQTQSTANATSPTQQTQPTADPPKAQVAAVVTAAPLVLVSDNPRDRMKEITDKLENGIKGIFESEKYKSYLNTVSKFHNYSFNNCLLIAMQKPNATRVAGFNAWQKDFKRSVIKGEKGMKIIAPAPFKTKKAVDKLDATGKPVIGTDGKRVKEEKEITVPAFTVATVFDVSQTEGEPLPQLGVNELVGSVDKYKEFFAAVEKVSPCPIDFEKITTGAKGYFHLEEKRIAINEGMSELQNLKTLIHEVAHARIHDIDKNADVRPDRNTREVEAESIAYAVCQHYGLDTSDYSFGYVASWSGGKELDILKSSLDTIRKEADAIITEIDKNFAELSQDKVAMQGLTEEVKATVQFFIDEDMKNNGELSPGTLEMIAVQGFEYRDGKLEEALPPNGTFSIYQLKDGDETRNIRFQPFDRLKESPNEENYNNVYTAPLKHGDSPDRIFVEFNHDRPKDFTGHSLSVSDVVVMNRDGKETAFYVDSAGFKELPDFLTEKEAAKETPTKDVDLKIVADYMQKLYDAMQAVKPGSPMCEGSYNATVKLLNKSNERIPDTQPLLKALITHTAQSTDFNMLKERMETLKTEFIQHYSTAAQNTMDTSGKAEPLAPKPPAQGEHVAAIEAKVKAGETINLSDLSDAIKKDNAANTSQPKKQNQTAPRDNGKKPSFKEKLAEKKKQAGQKSAPARTTTKNKTELGE